MTRVALVLLAVFLLPPLAAHSAWWLQRPRPLRLVILDKTVPDRTFREHAGLVWILGNQRWVHPDGRSFRRDRGYFGFHPLGDGRFEVRALPDTLAAADLIYVADAYGVTAADLYGEEGEDASRLLYGGLREDEVEGLWTAVEGGVPLVVEFSTLGDPTGPRARARMETLLGVEWTGWEGRWVEELAEARRTGGDRTHDGPGLVLTHPDGRALVLEAGAHLEAPGPVLEPGGTARGWGMREGVRFHERFSIVRPAPDAEVLAELRLAPTDEGRRALDEAGVPSVFPAVVRRQARGTPVYYLAGDFADRGTVPGWQRFRGIPSLFRVLPMPSDDPMASFWKAYLPLMRAILDDAGQLPR